jgi:outer membrane protein TolC
MILAPARTKSLVVFAFTLFNFCVFCVAVPSRVRAAQGAQAAQSLPPEAERLLSRLPNRVLTLDMVLALGATRSDSFEQVVATGASAEAPRLLADGALAPKVTASGRHFDDRFEVANPIASPIETKGFQYGLSVEKPFSTGTVATAGVEHRYTDLTFPSSLPFPIDRPRFHETVWKVGVTQRLWKDSFGASSRRELAAGRLASEAQQSLAAQEAEDWTLNFVKIYYEAWYSQMAKGVAAEALEARRRLLRTTALKETRGTAERPDRLQVESAQLRSQHLADLANQDLGDKWRQLILVLKLPAEFLSVDPSLVPLRLDDPVREAESWCQKNGKASTALPETSTVRLTQSLGESARLMKESKEWQLKPDLALFGEVGFNNIDGSQRETLTDAFSTDHPAWAVGLSLTFPLSFDKEKGDYIRAYADQVVNESRRSSAVDQVRVQWMNECSSLERLKSSRRLADEGLQKQKSRVRMEESRFQHGRIPVFNVIQAGDDARDSQLFLHQQELALRVSAWMILRLANEIPEKLAKLKDNPQLKNL